LLVIVVCETVPVLTAMDVRVSKMVLRSWSAVLLCGSIHGNCAEVHRHEWFCRNRSSEVIAGVGMQETDIPQES